MCSFAELCHLPGGAELLQFSANSDDSSALYPAKRQDHPTVVFVALVLLIVAFFACFKQDISPLIKNLIYEGRYERYMFTKMPRKRMIC